MRYFAFAVLLTIISCSFSYCQENPFEVIEAIEIKEGMKVCEVGAGDGFYSFLFSEVVGINGHVFVNEINRKLLKGIDERISKENIPNMSTILGRSKDPCLPNDSVDLVFLRHVLHCMKKPEKWMNKTGDYLPNGSRMVIIDGDPDITGYGNNYLIRKETVLKMAEESGFILEKLETFLLPEDYIYIFRKL